MEKETELNTFTLNKYKPKIEFKLNSKESYLLIKSVCVTSKNDFDNQWVNFISKVTLIAELKYIVYVDLQGRFIDDRTKEFPINLFPDLHQVQPLIYLNKLIKNETLKIGWNPEVKFYQTLKLELQEIDELDDDYSLTFDVELFQK
jgi:hypothetical protein